MSEAEQRRIETIAADLVEAARAGRGEAGGVDSFLHEYGLSSEEGVLLLCLAEALLRIPDAATADRLIAGTVGSGDWARHLGHSDSLLVNASTFGLMLTGRVVDWGESQGRDLGSAVQRLVGRSGEPVIRQALRQAMRILGGQFVLGQTIEEALAQWRDERDGGRLPLLLRHAGGGGAHGRGRRALHGALHATRSPPSRTKAGHPFLRTEAALMARPGLSVKLSALHPRYHPAQAERLHAELLPRLRDLAMQARAAWLPLTIDAEEADKLDAQPVACSRSSPTDPALEGWNGLGLAVQAYSKRALPVIDWLAEIAAATRSARARAPGQGRLLGQRDQMGAGGGARRLPRVHAQGQHRRRLSRRRARLARARGRLLSAIRHP